MKRVTVTKEVHDLLRAHAIGILDEGFTEHHADGTVTFFVEDAPAERLQTTYPGLPLAEAVELTLRGGRKQ